MLFMMCEGKFAHFTMFPSAPLNAFTDTRAVYILEEDLELVAVKLRLLALPEGECFFFFSLCFTVASALGSKGEMKPAGT